MGDSRGHWEGNTLVVETTNFNNETGVGGGFFSPAAKVTERFTRVAQDEMSYDGPSMMLENLDQALDDPHAL